MNEFTITFIIAIIALIVILFLLILTAILKSINIELKSQNENLKDRVSQLYGENQSLKYEVAFQKTVSKTFSDGLEALTNKNKN